MPKRTMKDTTDISKRVRPYDPPHLYKYRGLKSTKERERLAEVFASSKIYMPDPTDFNDPFDCMPRLCAHEDQEKLEEFYRSANEDPGWIEKQIRSRSHEDVSTLKGWYRTALKKWGVFSLSEKNDDVLMWSYYADGHKGICLEFDTSAQFFETAVSESTVSESMFFEAMLFEATFLEAILSKSVTLATSMASSTIIPGLSRSLLVSIST